MSSLFFWFVYFTLNHAYKVKATIDPFFGHCMCSINLLLKNKGKIQFVFTKIVNHICNVSMSLAYVYAYATDTVIVSVAYAYTFAYAMEPVLSTDTDAIISTGFRYTHICPSPKITRLSFFCTSNAK